MIQTKIQKAIAVMILLIASVASMGNTAIKNAIYIEGMGAGIIYSVNYERYISNDFAVRGGLGYFSWISGSGDELFQNVNLYTFLMPLMVSYLGFHHNSHYAEIGAGATLVTMDGGHGLALFTMAKNSASTFALGNIQLGYRFQQHLAGIQFRGGFHGFFAPGLGTKNASEMGFAPSLYGSIGFAF